MGEGEPEGWKGVLGRITEGLDTCLWPLLSSKDTAFLEGALLLFPTKRHLLSLPPTTPPSTLCCSHCALQAPYLCSTSVLARTEWTPGPHQGRNSPLFLSARSSVSGFPLPRNGLPGESLTYHFPNPCLAHPSSGKS